MNIIVAFTSKTLGIGNKNSIPWNIKEDLKRFYEITKDSVIVMGYNTWVSLPEDNRPLKDRMNIVVTRNPIKNTADNLVFLTINELDSFLMSQKKPIFIIGGESLYKRYLGIAEKLYVTIIEKEYECDRHFPSENFSNYEIVNYSESMYSEEEKCKYRFYIYSRTAKKNGEFTYLNHMQNILDNGDVREDRTGTGTISVFGGQLRFDISKSIPMLTTKFVPFQLTLKELLFFLRGQTDTKILEKEGVMIWSGNTSREFLDKRGLQHYEVGDMGPMYGFAINFASANYEGCDKNYEGQGINQLNEVVKSLKEDPWSRRHLMTTYYVPYLNQSVLYPCHGIVIQYQYIEKNGNKYLSCHVYIRSSDGFLGLPINILSYAILTYIIAKKCGYLPYELIISFGDAHIYSNLINQTKQQLERSPLPFPVLEISDDIINKEFKDIQLSDFSVIGYISHPKISGQMAI